MNTQKLNINEYIAQADGQYSGANGGMDAGLPGMGNDLYFSGANGAGNAPAVRTPKPFKVIVYNSTGSDASAVLFGFNKYGGASNFGSAAGLELTTGFTGVEYAQLLRQSAFEPFETSLMRVRSSNTSQVLETLNITVTNSDGSQCTDALNTEDYFSVAQQQATFVDVPVSLTINGSAYITTTILAGARATYTFFPIGTVSTARSLPGFSGNPVKTFSAPAVQILANQRPGSYPALPSGQGNY